MPNRRSAGGHQSTQNNYKAHKARQVTEPVAAADRVIALTEPHMLVLMRSYPQYAAKITVMKRDIADPYGGAGGL